MADDFNFDFSDFSFWDSLPSFDFSDFSLWDIPSFDFPSFDFSGFDFGLPPLDFSFPDPLALPPIEFGGFESFQPGFQQPNFPGTFAPGPGMVTSLADLGFGAPNAPQTALPDAGLAPSSDPFVNLLGQYSGPGVDEFAFQETPGAELAPVSTGGYQLPGSLSLTQGEGPEGFQMPPAFGGVLSQAGPPSAMESNLAAMRMLGVGQTREPSTLDNVHKVASAFGPTALGGLGLGLQAANRPKRNPLEDQLIQSRIESQRLQDSLAKERLQFEREQAAAMLEAQQAMQSQLIQSRAPGGAPNIQALLAANPQLAALYQALTQSSTGLAQGNLSPEFQAIIDQVAQVDITALQQQAAQQKAQAMEMANRQGVNPAAIIAKIDQTLLQQIAQARANARTVLLQQLQPGMNLFNMAGSLFGNMAQSPSFAEA